MSALPPGDWLEALVAEFELLATRNLGVPSVERVATHDAPPQGMEGAYLALLRPGGPSYQVGLVATTEGCQKLARGLLMLGADDETPPPADVADAICEVVNMLSGGVQRRLRERGENQLSLGLPTFFHGPVQVTERLGVAVGEVKMGEIPAALLILHPRTHRA